MPVHEGVFFEIGRIASENLNKTQIHKKREVSYHAKTRLCLKIRKYTTAVIIED